MFNRILLIGAGNEGLDIISKAKAYGLSVSHINQPGLFKERFLEYLDDVVIMDYSDIEKTVAYAKLMHQLNPVDAVISLSENALVVSAHVAQALGLKGNPAVSVEALKDKVKMRARLAEAGVSKLPFADIVQLKDLQTFADSHGFPMIVKPADGTRSADVYQVLSQQELASVSENISPLLAHQRFIAEAYLEGPEISVEAFSCHGQHTIVAITDKITDERHIELGHLMPSLFQEKMRDRIEHMVTAFLDAIGIESGPSHTELRLTADGPRIIESHNRVGGDRINELMSLAYDFDMRAFTIGWFAGKEKPLQSSPVLKTMSAIHFLTAEPGIVECAEVDSALTNCDYVEELKLSLKPGDTVKPLRSSSERVGHIIVTGESREQLESRIRNCLAQIKIQTVAP